MPFYCPQCLTPGSLEITLSIELPADSRSDDITLQVVRCSRCQFGGLAVYEESRRGALDSEAWEHTGYRVSPEDLQGVADLIRNCPDRYLASCPCPSHRKLGQSDDHGRWRGLPDVQKAGTFSMRLAH